MSNTQTSPQETIKQLIAVFLTGLADSEWQPPYAHSLAMVVYRLARGETEQAQQNMAEALVWLGLEANSEDLADVAIELTNVAVHADTGLITGAVQYAKGDTPATLDFRIPYTSEAMELYDSSLDGEA